MRKLRFVCNEKGRFAHALNRHRRPAPGLQPIGLPALRGAATAVATTAAGALLGLVHAQRTTTEVLAVEALDGLRGIGARHLNETETARAAGVAVGDDAHGLDGAVLSKQLAHFGVGSGERQVANIDLRHAINSYT